RGNVEITFDDIINDEALNEIESEDADLKDFFQKIEIIKEDIGIIKINITNVDKQQNVILTSTTITTEQETRELLDQTMADISKRSQRTKRLLKEIKEGVEEDQENGDNSSHCRMKRCQFNALSLEFMDNMTRYNAIQELFRAKSKSRIKRQLNITKKTEVSDEELEEMLENKEPINIFTQGSQIQMMQNED
uniref:Syntaxin N-terminal domain-containing protein n=1 Tax=Clytia hemisphaerica TaxID=252671 RepID=A0A7M6DQS0_9CNID